MHVMPRPIAGRVRILVRILPVRHFAVRSLQITNPPQTHRYDNTRNVLNKGD